MYMQVVGVLVVMLLLYYATMIALDIQKQKAAKAAELENSSEIDIDISDEARTFKPVFISRDEPIKGVANTSEESDSSAKISGNDESAETSQIILSSDPDSYGEEPFRRPGYREPIMTDGVKLEVLLDNVNRIAETGTSDLGSLIYRCESSRITS